MSGRRQAALALAAALLPACSGPPPAARPAPEEGGSDGGYADAAADDATADGPDDGPTYAPTYSAVYSEILAPSCALPFCHGGSADYLQLGTQALGYSSLVNVPAQGPDCASTGLKRVDPGQPDASLLYLKITNPPCGAKMPDLLGESLAPRQIQQIETWIELGALDD